MEGASGVCLEGCCRSSIDNCWGSADHRGTGWGGGEGQDDIFFFTYETFIGLKCQITYIDVRMQSE